jgi:hydrogenase maturation protease
VRSLHGRLPDWVRLVEHEGEPTALIDEWDGADLAIVVDAIWGRGRPGALRLFDATESSLPSHFTGSSTHAFDVSQAIELARALGRLPERLVVIGIEGRSFEAGATRRPEVTSAIGKAARLVLEQIGSHDATLAAPNPRD